MPTLLGTSQNFASARLILRTVNSTQARIAIMRVLLEEAPVNKDKSASFDEIISEFESLTTERNNCAHGLWWTTDSGKVSRSDPSYTNEALSFAVARRIPLKELEYIVARMEALFQKVMNVSVADATRTKERLQPSSEVG